jgi:hypothetical protein
MKAPAPSKTQQLLRKAGSLFGPAEGGFGKSAARFVYARARCNELEISDDDGEHIIEVVCNPAG